MFLRSTWGSASFSFALGLAVSACSGAPADDVSTIDEPVTSGGTVSFSQNAYGVTFTNNAGSWVVYTGCFGPKARGGTDLTVGPGYIARLVLKHPTPDGVTEIVNDERPLWGDGTPQTSGTLSSPGHGGLGAFGWHHARGVPPFQLSAGNPTNAWEITGRFCAEDHGNFGVSKAEVVTPPAIDGTGAGVFAIDVFFSDAWTYPSPLLKVRYRYLVRPNVVDLWAVVTELCDEGACGSGAPGRAFIKEPKLMSAVVGGGYTRLAIFDDKNALATNRVSSHPTCLWQGSDPRKATGQCDADHRVRARFDYGDATSGGAGGCDAVSHFCLNTVMRAYRHVQNGDVVPGLASDFFENGVYGLDAWAVASAARPQADTKDSPAGGAQWGCYGGSPAVQSERRWEMAAWGTGPGHLTAAGFGFHAWEGGTGAYDCEPLTRRFGPAGETFAIHAEYAVNGGWSVK